MTKIELSIRKYESRDRDTLIQLWRDCELVVPWNDPGKDIKRKMDFQPDLLIIAELDQQVIGSVMIGYEGHRGWINYLAVHPAYQRHGYGQALMEYAEKTLMEMGCPKINLLIRETNLEVIAFYESIGYKQDKVVSFGKRLISDE